MAEDWKEKVYESITDDEDGRSCEDIPDSACRKVPGNFLWNVLNGSATKLAEQLASPGLVLPWLLSSMGAPAFLAGLLVPVKRAGSLIPQMAIAGKIRSYKKRKWFWVGAGITQSLMLLLMAIAAFYLTGIVGGLVIVGLLALFSFASGVGSVSFKDVLAKTIPKGERGTLLSVRAAIGGILSLAAGFLIVQYLEIGESSPVSAYILLLLIASGLWVLGALFFARIKEYDGATAGARNTLEELKAAKGIWKKYPGFARFIIARALLLSVQLATPFYALFAREFSGHEVSSLGFFIVASSLAAIVSSPFWGKFSDRSSRMVMVWGGLFGVFTALFALGLLLLPDAYQTSYVFAAIFFFIGIAQAGVRLGRKTYLVDAAPEKERPSFVALSNTLVGVLILAGGGLGLIADIFSIQILIVTLLFIALIGVWVAYRLPEAEEVG